MNDDLIKRGHAIVYAVSGCVRNIDGEDWIRTSEVRQSLNDVPTVEQKEKELQIPVCEVKFDQEQMQELVDKAKAEVLASIERPQCEWIPVRKKLPDVVRRYLVYTKYNEMMTDFFTGDKFMQGDDILAWMPLPEPYIRGGEEE